MCDEKTHDQSFARDALAKADSDKFPIQPPQPAALPPLFARTHSFNFNTQKTRNPTNFNDLEAGRAFEEDELMEFAPGHARQFTSDSITTTAPSRTSFPRTESEKSVGTISSGATLCEMSAPSIIGNTLDARNPDTSLQEMAADELSGSDAPKKDIVYSISSLNKYDDHIADKEQLARMLEQHPLEEVEGHEGWNRLRYGFFSVYRRLHAIVLIANLIAIFIRISQVVLHPGSFTYADAATAVAANLFIGTMCRHEHCINMLFRICTALPHWVSLSIRRHAAKVYSQGGVHSACGISAFLWYIFLSVLLPIQWQGSEAFRTAVMVLSGVLLLDLAILIGMAMPSIRAKFHDQWEMSHRFGGWFAVLVVWTQITLLVHTSAVVQNRSYGYCLVTMPAFWFLVAITLMMIYPWIRLRRRKVVAEQLSSHAVRLNFPDHQRRMSTCAGIRLATSPLVECHGFATIPEPNGEKGYSVVVSNAGDWTKSIIENPPTHLWSRGAPTLGVARAALLFKRIVFVTTGSGVGPALSFLQVHPEWPCRVLWSARSPEATYGGKIMDAVLAADSKAVIIDTKKTGKPDLVGLTYSLVKETQAEAVFIIANPKATGDVVFNMETRKIPAYGAIFDS